MSATLLVSACVPRQAPTPQAPAPQRQPGQPAPQRNDLIGLTAAQLIAIFGTPALQVREGAGLKLQFRGRNCVLDAYLYPEPRQELVSYVEARSLSGEPANAQGCYDALKAR